MLKILLFKKRIFALTLFLLIATSIIGQNVYIPDPNFRNYLNTSFPFCMVTQDSLNTACAATVFTPINLYSMGISDLTGIEHFTNINALYCSHNNLSALPSLPNGLLVLQCQNNNLTSLPPLPNNLTHLYCSFNNLLSLPTLPNSLQYLQCNNNSLSFLPALPNGISDLRCSFNNLINLPTLPNNLQYLICNNNSLTQLPSLPSNLLVLACDTNNISQLPSLPANLYNLFCNNNNLNNIPNFPSSLEQLNCSNNNISCFPIFPNSITNINISNNNFNCLPNYLSTFNSDLLAYPLCTIGNSNNCTIVSYFQGFVLNDVDSNCVYSNNDEGLKNINIKLYDSNYVFIRQSMSLLNGGYQFFESLNAGEYYIEIDTINKPYEVICNPPGALQEVTYNLLNIDSINFLVRCKNGFDVGVQNVVPLGWVFPGQTHNLIVSAGDISQIAYNLDCSSIISGQVIVEVSGPVSFAGFPFGALIPTISGNTFTYNISDFSAVNNNSFRINFTTNTTAQSGDSICITVNVTPQTGDLNPSNNFYQFCYEVINSYDPNRKDVYPERVQLEYSDWLIYTIYFQNTGTAPAFNIRIVDTLSPLLDNSSIQVLNYSHNTFLYELKDGVAIFYFNNIMLPDSTSNPDGSIGYVQFKLKPNQSFTSNTVIENQVGIFFDFNPPIFTNKVTTSTIPLSIKEVDENLDLIIYPVPTSDVITIMPGKSNDFYQIEVFDINGKFLKQQSKLKGTVNVNVSDIDSGVYLMRVNTESGKTTYKRFIIQ